MPAKAGLRHLPHSVTRWPPVGGRCWPSASRNPWPFTSYRAARETVASWALLDAGSPPLSSPIASTAASACSSSARNGANPVPPQATPQAARHPADPTLAGPTPTADPPAELNELANRPGRGTRARLHYRRADRPPERPSPPQERTRHTEPSGIAPPTATTAVPQKAGEDSAELVVTLVRGVPITGRVTC